MRTIATAVMLSLTAILLLGQAIAQEPPAPGPPEMAPPPPPGAREADDPLQGKDLRQLIETVKMVRLSQELGLNDEQTIIMMRKYDRYRDQLAQLRRDRQQLMRQLKEATQSGKPDAGIEKALQDLLAHDRKISDIRNQAFEDAGKDLNATQRAKLYVFLNDFEDDMRRLIQRARQAGAGRGMRLREMRDNAFGRPEGPGGPEDQQGMPPGRQRPGFGMRGGPFNPPPPQGETPPPFPPQGENPPPPPPPAQP